MHLRRQEPTIDELEYVITENNQLIKPKFQTAQPPELLEETATSLLYKLKNGLKLRLYTGGTNRAEELMKTTGSKEFWTLSIKPFPNLKYTGDESENDEIVFEKAKIPFIPPMLRETAAIVDKAKKKHCLN